MIHLDSQSTINSKVLDSINRFGATPSFKFGQDINTNNVDLAYPRIDSYNEIMSRTAAIVDNLDEVIMLPQAFVFPLRPRFYAQMRRRVSRPEQKEASMARRPHDQEEYLEEYHDFGY